MLWIKVTSPPNLIIFVALNESKDKEISKEIKRKNNSPLETFFWYKDNSPIFLSMILNRKRTVSHICKPFLKQIESTQNVLSSSSLAATLDFSLKKKENRKLMIKSIAMVD